MHYFIKPAFIGEMLIAMATLHIPVQISFLVIFASLPLAIAASLFSDRKQNKQTVSNLTQVGISPEQISSKPHCRSRRWG
ncbi:MAG: hypothetical protein Q7U44_10250 [Desulfuromonadales bacterium]|nr:hypothetical protein [Desulfuromonadales bacterium]